MPEKKEKFKSVPLGTTKSKQLPFWGAAMPLYVGILLLVLGIVAGFAMHTFFFPAKPLEKPVPAVSLSYFFVTHPDCKLCPAESSFELLLKQRKIPYEQTIVDATSVKGAAMMQKFDISSFPTVVVDAINLENADPPLYATLQTKYTIRQGSFVLPEKDFMQQTKIYSAYMLAKIPPGVLCPATDAKAQVWEFGDLLEPASFDTLKFSSQVWTDLNGSVEYDFKYLSLYPPHSEQAAAMDVCTKPQGIFFKYHSLAMARKNNQGREIWNWIEGRNIAQEVGLTDVNSFQACVDSNETKQRVLPETGIDANLSRAFEIKQIPSFVLDCRFVIVNPSKLKEDICLQRPDLSACETA